MINRLQLNLVSVAMTFLVSIYSEPKTLAMPFEDSAATVAEVAKVLDLQAIELPKGAKASGSSQIGQLTYEVSFNPKEAFEFHRKSLLKTGWTELPGSATEDAYASGMFAKSGFTLSLSASSNGATGIDAASYVSMFNLGNVPLDRIPVIDGAKPVFANAASASYVTELSVPKAAEQMTKVLRKNGWKHFGVNALNDEQHFVNVRKNAVQVSVMLSKAPAQGNKTFISMSSTILAAEIPAPDEAEQVQFDGQTKTLRFAIRECFADISRFYVSELGDAGWKATSEKPAESDDEFGRETAIQAFRNSEKSLMSIEMRRQDDLTIVSVSFKTQSDLEEEKRRALEAVRIARAENEKSEAESKAAREKARMEFEESSAEVDALASTLIAEALSGKASNRKPAKGKTEKSLPSIQKAVVIQVPKGASLSASANNVLKVSVAGGKGLATAKAITEQLKSDGWKSDRKDLTDSSGNCSFSRDSEHINLTYVDTGFTDVTMMLIGIGVELEAAEASEPEESK